MKPDMDEYADIDETRPNASRAMSWMVLAVAVGGFAALAYYAYHSGIKAGADGEAMTVEADNSPIKQAPADAGGEQFPDKDKTIYDVISPNGDAKGSEKLMPEPEHPIAAGNVEDSEDDNTPGAPSAPVPSATNGASTFVAKSADGMANTASSAPQSVSEQPVATTAKPATAAPAATTPATYSSPQMVNQKTIGKKDAPAAAPTATPAKAATKPVAKAAAKPAAKPAATASTGGAYQVQLGAFKSEAEAQAAWKKLSGAHNDALSGTPNIVQADVNGTTYYRLRAGSFASSADAKALCGKLGGAACMAVK